MGEEGETEILELTNMLDALLSILHTIPKFS